jgi:undecaprenyl pyrophosphate phosphatase UppP
VPALIGGQWAVDLDVSAPESPYLAFIVGLHVATAAALLLFFWRDWVRILVGFVTSLRYRRVRTPAERLAWLIVIGTIPVGLAGNAVAILKNFANTSIPTFDRKYHGNGIVRVPDPSGPEQRTLQV